MDVSEAIARAGDIKNGVGAAKFQPKSAKIHLVPLDWPLPPFYAPPNLDLQQTFSVPYITHLHCSHDSRLFGPTKGAASAVITRG